jgi:hypothetical protein
MLWNLSKFDEVAKVIMNYLQGVGYLLAEKACQHSR